MTTDRTTKALLLAIALGLWMNLAAQWMTPLQAADAESSLRRIANDVLNIANGMCANEKIC